MNAPKERILLVESNPDISDLIARQTLLPMGYRVQVVGAANTAIQEAARFAPDVVIVNLNLPGLSGKDMLVALNSQGADMPVIVIAEKGMEMDVIQSFRLGATDFLSWPVREAEVVSAVERVLKQVRSKREREMLSRQLNQTNQELQRRVRELTTIFAMGKAVISVTDMRSLLDKIVEGAVYVAEADAGWLLTRDDRSKGFLLSAFRNLPKTMSANLNQPWDDGLSSLVALSGEPLAIHGEPLKRFKIASLGQAALVVPVKVKTEVVGLLVVVRKSPQPLGASSQALLEAVADYASIALVNASMFKAMEERAKTSQQVADSALVGEKIVDEILGRAGQELNNALTVMRGNVDMLLGATMGRLNVEQTNSMVVIRDRLKNIGDIADAMASIPSQEERSASSKVDLVDLTRQAISRFQPIAQYNGVTLFAEISARSILINANATHIMKVIESLLSNAIRFSPQGAQVNVRIEIGEDKAVHLSVQDKGPGLEANQLKIIFDHAQKPNASSAPDTRRFVGLAINLPLAKEIVSAYNGKMWVDSKPGAGSTFHFTLPASARG